MTIPPDTVAAGQSGHLSAHNNIADVLTTHGAQLSAIPNIVYGTATLAGGTVTVADSAITANSVPIVSRLSPSGTLGQLSVPTITPGSGFVISSSSASENSTVAYLVLG